MDVWGSMEAVYRERKKRKGEMEEGERYRKGNIERNLENCMLSGL